MGETVTVQSLDRTFDILELLSQERRGLSLTGIADRLDLHKSTVFRLLAALKNRGYVIQSGSRGLYKLGMEFLQLCSQYLNNLELKTEAEPYLHRLSQRTAQTVYLAIRQDLEVVYIDKVEQFNSLRKYSIIGQRRPLHCTSLGKALLTGMSGQEITILYAGKTLEALTPRTITDVEELKENISLCRRRGWCFDDQEFSLEERCIGAPVFDYREKVIAAVSTSWLVRSFPNANIEAISSYVIDAARSISQHMGYRPKSTSKGKVPALHSLARL